MTRISTIKTTQIFPRMLLFVLFAAALAARPARGEEAALTVTPLKYEALVGDKIESVKQMLISALEAKNYVVISVLNVQEALQGRGIDTQPLQLVEFCNLVKAYQITRTTHEFELFAPCRFALFEENGKTIVMTMRPSFIGSALPAETQTEEARDALREFDRDVREILEGLARGDI